MCSQPAQRAIVFCNKIETCRKVGRLPILSLLLLPVLPPLSLPLLPPALLLPSQTLLLLPAETCAAFTLLDGSAARLPRNNLPGCMVSADS